MAPKRRISKRRISKRRSSKRRISKRRSSKRRNSKRRISKRRSSKRRSSKRRISKRRSTKSKSSKRRNSKRRISKRRSSKRRSSKRRSKKRSSKRRSVKRRSKKRSSKRRSKKRSSKRRSKKRRSSKRSVKRRSKKRSSKRRSVKRRSKKRSSKRRSVKRRSKKRSSKRRSSKRRSKKRSSKRSVKRRSKKTSSKKRSVKNNSTKTSVYKQTKVITDEKNAIPESIKSKIRLAEKIEINETVGKLELVLRSGSKKEKYIYIEGGEDDFGKETIVAKSDEVFFDVPYEVMKIASGPGSNLVELIYTSRFANEFEAYRVGDLEFPRLTMIQLPMYDRISKPILKNVETIVFKSGGDSDELADSVSRRLKEVVLYEGNDEILGYGRQFFDFMKKVKENAPSVKFINRETDEEIPIDIEVWKKNNPDKVNFL